MLEEGYIMIRIAGDCINCKFSFYEERVKILLFRNETVREIKHS
jgi:hypothetical protein